MAAPTEFTLESVRAFMLERGGKVTNHELVKHFKQFLTDPYTKEYARVQFKEYVNTLALIRQEESDKFLVLKPIFYPTEYLATDRVRDVDPSYHSVGLPLLPSQPQYVPPPPPHVQHQHYGQPPMDVAPAFRAPPPYRPPPEPAPFRRSSLSGSDLSHSPVNVYPPPQVLPYNNYQPPPPPAIPPLPSQKLPAPPPPPAVHHFVRQTSLPSDDFIPASAYLLPQQQPMPERSVSIQDFSSHHVQDLTSGGSPGPVVPPRRLKAQRSDDKENHLASLGSSCSSIDGVVLGSSSSSTGGLNNEEIKISVKERTQRFNKMASEIDLVPKNGSSERRDSKSKSGDDDDTSSVGTMEPRAKEWMLATARGDYHAIARLLREEPRLARRRDFVTGYTGLHWAAKHGNDDLIKLLAGTHKSDVNARTNAGCTPLHLAAMQGHADVVDLLVKAYGADSNMRDYSGKKPHQYLSRPDTVISIDTFRSEYNTKSSYSSFERGGLYSSTKAVLKNSLLKLTPGHHSTYSESSLDSKLTTSSTESCYSEQGSSLTLKSNPEKKRHLAVSHSMLREFRPSIRRRANSSSAFVNNTT